MGTNDIKRLDVIQINPKYDNRFGGCFMVVTKLTPDGAYGYIDIPPGAKVVNGGKLYDLGVDVYRAFYICPYDQCMKIGIAEWVPEDEQEEKKSDIPFVGFSAERLAKCPIVVEGDMIECMVCGGEHKLESTGDNSNLLFYECQGQYKLGGIGGRLIVNVKPTLSGG